jgi:hypothetical protein
MDLSDASEKIPSDTTGDRTGDLPITYAYSLNFLLSSFYYYYYCYYYYYYLRLDLQGVKGGGGMYWTEVVRGRDRW